MSKKRRWKYGMLAAVLTASVCVQSIGVLAENAAEDPYGIQTQANEEVLGKSENITVQSENGKKLAEILQTALIEQVDPDNHRAAKSNESYYLLKKTPTPTVIVECGFLSNPTEAELLLQDDYQDQLVNAIYTGIKTYLGDELPQNESS